MALSNRVTEHPGRVILTPVSGETNTYDMERAEGQVVTPGSQLSAELLNREFKLVTEDLAGTVTYEAGTIGTRGVAVNLGSIARAGYLLVGAIVINSTNKSAYSVETYVSSGNLYADITRRSAAAVSDASITVRAVWAPV